MKKIELKEFIHFVFFLVSMILISLLFNQIGLNKENNILIYIIGVLIIATFTSGYFYGILAALISALCYNYFFTLPIYNFHMSEPSDVMLVFFFFVTSLIACNLTNRFQVQLLKARENEKISKDLYQLSEGLLNVTGKEAILNRGKAYIHETIGLDCIIYDEKDEIVTDYPIQTANHILGYIQLPQNCDLAENDQLILKTIANQLGYALEREINYLNQESIKLAMEKEHTTNSMLRSISHDLRTPLTGIVGASQILVEKQNDEDLRLLSKDINEQAQWLTQMVENILNMSKIENDSLILNKNYELVDDLIYSAIQLRPELKTRELKVSLPNELIFINVDGKMIVQTLVNLLDNAIKYTSIHQRIDIIVHKQEASIIIDITDQGLGIKNEIIEHIFDEFVTSPGISEDSKKGIGLGLAICKAVIELHNGHIIAKNNKEGGATFSIVLPLETEVNING